MAKIKPKGRIKEKPPEKKKKTKKKNLLPKSRCMAIDSRSMTVIIRGSMEQEVDLLFKGSPGSLCEYSCLQYRPGQFEGHDPDQRREQVRVRMSLTKGAYLF
jgi:hypothetical protein